MKTVNELKVVNADFDLDSGFFWIEFDNKKSLQCCLEYRKDETGYKKSINSKDNGSGDGLSYDNNSWALTDEYGLDEIDALLHKEARKLGIKIN